ncbi:MAG: site-specific DNA-methyltransferase [Rhodoplanes sp.]|uniref:site-specific DNA-methyltransferase n=1 Tax=Rhodoplanes sp. TaxID=1968906 RepID=UPI00184CAEA0|nr:DNA methyltransferase [Rhodoplanes sp.]NVO17595.1 site-specific DNA-methyltransferase [Rhodoplanes sp.]
MVQYEVKVIRDLAVEWLPTTGLRTNPRNARTHSKRQLQALAGCIREVGFTNPVIVDEDGMILAGHGRVGAAKLLGLDKVPVIRIGALSEAQKRAYVLADNKLAERAGWDRDMLAVELGELSVLLPAVDLSLDLTGFETGEIDVVLADHEEKAQSSRDDEVGLAPETAVSRVGDLWRLGRHRIFCGDARDEASLGLLLGDERADMVFTDPPYNVPIEGHVMGRGGVKHPEFAMASGEMSESEFRDFLALVLGHAVRVSRDGALHYVAMDWRHIADLVEAGKPIYSGLRNICVWTKSNGGQGSLYRSQHELFAVFKVGEGEHANNVELGRFGRNRSNVWSYAGVNTFKVGRQEELAFHPTVKPAALVADAIKDVTSRHAIVLDLFGGSGTTLIAAERTGRRARLIEIEPRYVDVTIRRFETLTKSDAVHAETGRIFAEEAAVRGGSIH